MTEPQVSFSRYDFEKAFDDFEAKLKDFGAIIRAIDAWESNKDFHHEATMGTSIRTTLLVGEAHPFSLTFELYSFETDDEESARRYWESERSSWVSDANTWATEQVQLIQPKFDILVDPWPFYMSIASSEFNDIRTVLGTQVGDDFAQLEYSQSHWEGLAAASFFSDFYNQMPQCVINLAWVAEMLESASAAAKGILDLGQQSSMNMVSAMVTRVEDALLARQDAHSMDATEYLTMASTILDLLDLLPIGIPDSLQNYVEQFDDFSGDFRQGAAAAIGYAADAIPESAQTTKTAASQRPEGVVSDFKSGADDLRSDMNNAWIQFSTDYLSKVEKNVASLEELKLLWLPRPDLANGNVPPPEFHHNSQ